MNNKDTLCEILSGSPKAAAKIHGSNSYPDICGRAAFYSFGNAVLVRAEIMGLPQSIDKCKSPVFAFHIHAGGSCTGNAEDPFSGAGSHITLTAALTRTMRAICRRCSALTAGRL